MEDEEKKKDKKRGRGWHSGGGSAVYGLGFLGALVYFLQHSTSVWMGVLGIVKAVFWPALFVYKFLEFFKF